MSKLAQAILGALGYPEAELSISFVDDAEISSLNLQYLGRQGPTNVLAFPMLEGAHGQINPHVLGDVVISLDTAAREAQQACVSLFQRCGELLIHGTLHLVGHDHAQEEETRLMESLALELSPLIKEI